MQIRLSRLQTHDDTARAAELRIAMTLMIDRMIPEPKDLVMALTTNPVHQTCEGRRANTDRHPERATQTQRQFRLQSRMVRTLDTANPKVIGVNSTDFPLTQAQSSDEVLWCNFCV